VVAAILAQYLAAAETREVLRQYGLTVERLTQMLTSLFLATGGITVAAVRAMAAREFTDALQGTSVATGLVDAMVAVESRLEDAMLENSTRRFALAIRRAVVEGDDIAAVIERTLQKERRYGRLHLLAARRRVQLRVEEANVRALSPDGAYWLLDPTRRTHTVDCLAMAGKAWSWSVLSRISPANRHLQCGCQLVPLGEARANAYPDAQRVRTRIPRAALRD
jgi:hypothetical protein